MTEAMCDHCGKGGERRMAGSLLIYRHLRPSDHRFVVAAPRRAQDDANPPASSASDRLSPVDPAPFPEQLLAASD